MTQGERTTCMVNRVFTNSRGYVSMVELTPAHAPAIREGGIGTLDCSPGFGDKRLLTVSYARSYMEESRRTMNIIFMNYVLIGFAGVLSRREHPGSISSNISNKHHFQYKPKHPSNPERKKRKQSHCQSELIVLSILTIPSGILVCLNSQNFKNVYFLHLRQQI